MIKTPVYSHNPTLLDKNKAVAKLQPDGFGTYVIGLKAFDGENWSKQKRFNIVFGSETLEWKMNVDIHNLDTFYEDIAYEGLPIVASGSVSSNNYDIIVESYKWRIYEIDNNPLVHCPV